jgi:hypothetical protein
MESKAGKVYLVHIKHIPADVTRRWRNTLPNGQKSSKVVKCKAVCLIAGTRSYDCEVVGVEGRFKLSSKCLAQADSSGSRAEALNDEVSSDINSESSYGDKAEPSECASSSDDEPVDEADIDYEHLTAQDWQKVQQFDCQCARLHPNVDQDTEGRLKANVPADPTALFLAFFPLELVEQRFEFWMQHAQRHDRRGLNNLNRPMFMRIVVNCSEIELVGAAEKGPVESACMVSMATIAGHISFNNQ